MSTTPSSADKSPTPTIEPLASYHDRAAFSCGAADQDRFLKNDVLRRQSLGVSRVFVLVPMPASSTIIGFYALSNAVVAFEALPKSLRAWGLPTKQPLPATLLGQLAVDSRYQNRGIGKILILRVLREALHASAISASFAVIVHAASPALAPLYSKYGFRSLTNNPDHMVVPMTQIAAYFTAK